MHRQGWATSSGSGADVDPYNDEQVWYEDAKSESGTSSTYTSSHGVITPDDSISQYDGEDEYAEGMITENANTFYGDEMRFSANGTVVLPHGVKMTNKIPPAYDGRMSWFAFEELVRDWEDICILEKTSTRTKFT